MTRREDALEYHRKGRPGKIAVVPALPVTDTLKRRDTITFTGFGKFSTSERAAREGVNPRNPSQKVQIPAATVPKFSAGSQLKAAVKGG